ncbi:ROK family protein [Horticoccus sp. 23ND18S-11]|uniref:ROK family protein n=1 Tax=Horticoccus sp. 23ND18S-11 TaxID=3391832 RepID=UPI0039C963C7
MKPHACAVGVDIGGTKIAVGVVAADGRVLAERTLPTDSRAGVLDGLTRIAAAVREVMHEAKKTNANVAGLGIGCAGPVDPVRGVIDNPHTLPGWPRAPIVAALTHELGVPVWLENDADAAALGECYYGAGRGLDPVVMLTFGTGVGGAVITRGEIFRGVGGEHPEIGHMPISFAGAPCYCGRSGCLESIVSGTAIAEAGKAIGLINAAAVFAAAAAGNAEAAAILSHVRRALDAAIWTVLHAYCPARIILGGGLVEAQEAFFTTAARTARVNAHLVAHTAVEIVPARLGARAGLVGAAGWALQRSQAHGRPAAHAPHPPQPLP